MIGRSATNFLQPITDDFTSELIIPKNETLDHFFEMYHRFGKARITLKAQIKESDKPLAEFEGDFVVIAPGNNETLNR